MCPSTGPLTFRNERDRKTQSAAQQQRDALRLPPAVVVQDLDDQDQRGDFDQTAQDEVAVPVTHYGTGAHRKAVIHERVDHPAGTSKYTQVKTNGKTDQKSPKGQVGKIPTQMFIESYVFTGNRQDGVTELPSAYPHLFQPQVDNVVFHFRQRPGRGSLLRFVVWPWAISESRVY